MYVGDEVRDIDAAKAVGLISVAVCWGFNSRFALEKAQPSFIADNPEELLEFIQELS